MNVSDEELAILRHALGSYSDKDPLGWRRHYAAFGETPPCERLVEIGFMTKEASPDRPNLVLYHVTVQGLEFTRAMDGQRVRGSPKAAHQKAMERIYHLESQVDDLRRENIKLRADIEELDALNSKFATNYA